MRPSRMVAGAALTAALALAALPGIAGSAGPTPAASIDPAAFQSIQVPAFATAIGSAAQLDSAYVSAGRRNQTIFTEPGTGVAIKTTARPRIVLPVAHGGSALKPPRYKLSGYATFYANGTTAMRLPRGTTIVVCGGGGCLERLVTDYGPVASDKDRIIDMNTPDFFSICGCPWYAGTTWVTVSIY